VLARVLSLAAARRPFAPVVAALPFAKQVVRNRTLCAGGIVNGFWGAFDHLDDAKAAIPANLGSDWSHAGTGHDLSHQPAFAVPIDWLTRTLQPGARVVDLGGGQGGLQRRLAAAGTLPDGVDWLVVETAAMVAASKPADGLRFAEALPDQAPNLLIVSGYLQYAHADMADFLAGLPWPVQNILINKTPIGMGEAFWTLQNLGAAVAPYRVYREADFMAAIDRAGYAVLDRWTAPELSVDVPFHPQRRVPALTGLWLEKRKAPVKNIILPGIASMSYRVSLSPKRQRV
jgi:putative methyltransferase (TIGR04325 family)